MLLLAAGCALLMRSGGGFARPREDEDGWTHENGYSTASPHPRSRENGGQSTNEGLTSVRDVKDRVTSAASDYARDIQERVSDAAADYTNNISSRVSDTANSVADAASVASRNIVESSKSIGRQAQTTIQSTIEGVLRDQPLAVAAVGFVAGAAVAAAFPATDVETRALRGARESLSEAVDEAGRKVMGAAGKAGERLKAVAEEKGLTTDGLKNLAGDVTDTFSKAVASGGQGKTAAEPATPSTSAETTKMVASDESGPGNVSGGPSP
jgi:hypothetical protein